MSHNSTIRFSNRVDNYIKYRPGYPVAILEFLKQENVLTNNYIVADVGSGTGISAELFLKNGNTVLGIEPNTEMREAAESTLKNYSLFKSIDASAENTSLQNNSVDLIICAQAFHWFDIPKVKLEFKRILKNNGYILLMWNDRRTDSSPFLREYEDLIINYATDYKQVNHKNFDEKIFDEFFGIGNYKQKAFDNFQHFDFEGLKGRLNSSSYVPTEGDTNYDNMITVLQELYNKHEKNNQVIVEYDTRIFYSNLK